MSKHDQEHSDIERRLFQIAEALSAEERNLLNNPAGLVRAADFIEKYFLHIGLKVTLPDIPSGWYRLLQYRGRDARFFRLG